MHFVSSIKEIVSKPYLLMYSLFILIIPFIFSRDTVEFYEFPKTVHFYVFTVIILAFFVTDLILNARKVVIPPKPFIVFAAMFLLSTVFSEHLHTSIFGYYSRFADSGLFYLALLIIYFVSINVFKDSDYNFLLDVAHLGSIPLFLLALGQYFSPINFLWGGETQERVFSTLGQPNWFAQYLLLLLSVSLFEFLNHGKERYFIFFFVQFFSLWLTFSMSGLLAFAVTLIYILFSSHIFRGGLRLRLFPVFAVLILIPVLFPGIFREKINDVFSDLKKIVYVNTVVHAQEGNLVSDPGYIRLGLWGDTWRMITSSPKTFLLGTGPETFPYYFQKFRTGDLNYSSEWNFVFNKPHNYYLETWAEQGLAGVLSYIAILLFAFKKSEKKYRSGIICFAITNIFGWPTVVPSVLFWIMLAASGRRR